MPIISLKREDAARLGYDNAESWKALLNSYAMEMAEPMKITFIMIDTSTASLKSRRAVRFSESCTIPFSVAAKTGGRKSTLCPAMRVGGRSSRGSLFPSWGQVGDCLYRIFP